MLLSIAKASLRPLFSAELPKAVNGYSLAKCRYCRWASRRPAAIVNESELFDDDVEATEITTPKVPCTRRKRKPKQLKALIKPDGKEPIYTALKEDDRLISSLMVDIKSKKRREKNNQILLEGLRLIEDALQAGALPKVIIFNRLSDLSSLSLPKTVQLYKVPYRTIQLWSNLTTSPGILGIFEMPDTSSAAVSDDSIPLTIICDNVRDPGNMGTIIRTAAAVGCERLLLLKGCVDLWEPKVLRGAAGSHFRLPIHRSLTWHEIPALISEESKLYLADNNAGHARQNRANDRVDDSTTSDDVDADLATDDANVDEAEREARISETTTTIAPGGRPSAKMRSLVRKLLSELPVVPYHSLDFTRSEVVLVIGGETEGVGPQSCELFRARNCMRVNVPLSNEVDSLNAGTAVGVVAFEIKRQFLVRKSETE